MPAVITKTLAAKVLKTVDYGLVQGLGKPVPGQMCVEAAVCYALGEPHGDSPSCVGAAVQAYKVRLNDSGWWPSATARAAGMRELAIAQLGSDRLDQREFAKRVVVATVRELISRLCRSHDFIEEAMACAAVKNVKEARIAVKKAREKFDATYAAYAAANADAAYAAASAAAYAANAANAAAYAAAYAADAHSILLFSARMVANILVEMGSPGAQFLYLCEAKKGS